VGCTWQGCLLIEIIKQRFSEEKVSISISVIRETSDLIEKYGDGSSPSEAHCGGWEGLGKDGGEPAL